MANLTLSVEDDLLKQCRLYAVQHDTSVNALVRDYLETLVDPRQERMRALAEIDRITEDIARNDKLSGVWKWNRDALYEERMARWDKK